MRWCRDPAALRISFSHASAVRRTSYISPQRWFQASQVYQYRQGSVAHACYNSAGVALPHPNYVLTVCSAHDLQSVALRQMHIAE